jgi:hypothetical protein
VSDEDARAFNDGARSRGPAPRERTFLGRREELSVRVQETLDTPGPAFFSPSLPASLRRSDLLPEDRGIRTKTARGARDGRNGHSFLSCQVLRLFAVSRG